MAVAKQLQLIKGVEAHYPRLNQTYRFDRSVPPKGKTVPCGPTEENARYETKFRMNDAQAKELYKAMVVAYKEAADPNWPEMPKPTEVFEKDADGKYIGSAQLKGQYSGVITEKPLQVDAKNRRLPSDFELTHGSIVNMGVTLVPYSMATHGVSLRLKAVQVITLADKKQHSPFDAQEGFSLDEDDPSVIFGDVTASAPVEVDEMPEPVKVAKKKEVVAPSANEADLASIVDNWDD